VAGQQTEPDPCTTAAALTKMQLLVLANTSARTDTDNMPALASTCSKMAPSQLYHSAACTIRLDAISRSGTSLQFVCPASSSSAHALKS
jgi:hypothetical protein